MPANPVEHPQIDLLNAFALGQLESADIDAVESHLASCETCCDALKQMKEDTFAGLVRAARDPGQGTDGVNDSAPVAVPAPAAEAVTQASNAPAMPHGSSDAATVAPDAIVLDTCEAPGELAKHGRYRIVELLGTGGMGSVYKAEHRLMQRTVALKVIHPRFIQSKQAVERFRREVQAAARLQHSNIVHAYDAEQAGDDHFLVMEYVKGTDLQKVLEERGPLPVAEACDYIRQAALGLQHAHESGMVHRDIKPQNLMVTRTDPPARSASKAESPRPGTGIVKILDFGLASLTTGAVAEDEATQSATVDSQKSGLTQAGSLMGTPDYMAPEQGRDAHSADIRSDIYSLGCTLYALLSGKVPFPGGTAIDKVIAHSANEPQPIRDLRPDTPTALVQVLDKMMAKNPADRYQTPAEVAAALASRSVLEPKSERGGRSGRSRSLVRAAVAAVFAGIVLVAGAVFYIVTDNGTIEIRIDDEKLMDNEKIKIVAKLNGKEITLHDFKNKKEWILDTGTWTLRLDGNVGDLELEMPHPFIMKRGGRSVVTIRRVNGSDREGQALPARFTNGVGIEFAQIPRGKSWLGGAAGKPGTQVVVIPRDFHMGVFEVTQEEWEKVTGNNPSQFSRAGARKNAVNVIPDADLKRFPVENISWDDAQLFLARLNEREKDSGWTYRLPTAAEWEYACRGGPLADKKDSAFDFYLDKPANVLLPEQANFQREVDLKRTSKVGSYRPNRLGLFDMHGNVWEWCADELFNKERVLHGGSWCVNYDLCRAEQRLGYPPTKRDFDRGLRLVAEHDGKTPIREMPTAAASEIDRKAADYVLFIGGNLHVNDRDIQIKATADLPRAPFRLSAVEIWRNARLKDADLVVFRDCKNLKSLNLGETQVSEAGLANFKDCQNLVALYLSTTPNLTDAGLAHFKGCRDLKYLHLGATQVTNAGLAHFKDCKELVELAVNSTQVTDAGLVPFMDCKNLTVLYLQDTRVTGEGIAKLKKALPQCRIEWDGGVIPPTTTAPGWTQLFNGKDLTGWKTPPVSNVWSVEDGKLVGRGIGVMLPSEREFAADFDLRCEAKVSDAHFFHVKMRLDAQGTGYGMAIRGAFWAHGVDKITNPPPLTPKPPANTWFTYEINARGPEATIKINGSVIAQLRGLTVRRGHLALHTMSPGTIQFRKIEIKELPAARTPDAPGQLQQNSAQVEIVWQSLLAREADPKTDLNQLRADITVFRRDFAGLPQALSAAQMLRRLPAPLDQLDPAQVAAELRNANLKELVAAVQAHPGAVTSLTFRPDGMLVSCSGKERIMKLWDLSGKSPAEVKAWQGHADTIWSNACNPDGKLLATSSEDKTARLWDLTAKGAQERTVVDGYRYAVTGLAFTADGRTLATASWDPQRQGYVRLLDVSGPVWIERAVVTGHTGLVQGIAFSPDGRTLASGALDGTVRLWDLTGPKPRERALLRHPDWVYPVRFSPDGSLLVSGCKDGRLRVWDATKEVPELRVELDGRGAFYSPDGGLLLASGSGKVVLWDGALPRPGAFAGLSKGKKLAEWDLPDIGAIAFSPDSRHLAFGSSKGVISILRVAEAERRKQTADAGWTQLFNGKDLTGWDTEQGANWTVENGLLVGRYDSKHWRAFLKNGSQYENFHLRFEVKLNEPAISDVLVRVGATRYGGYGFKLAPKMKLAFLFAEGLRFPGPGKKGLSPTVETDKWMLGEVIANGPNVTIKLDGQEIYHGEGATVRPGGISLNIQQDTVVQYKKIEIKELPSTTTLPSPPIESKTKSDKDLILGAWNPVSADAFGQPVPKELIDLMQPTITFTPDKLTAKVNLQKMPIPIDMLKKLLMGFDEKEKTLTPKELATVLDKQGVEAVYTIDPTKTPNSINISYLSPVRKTLLGIYCIEGDTLKLCVAVEPERAEERPSEFAAGPGQVYGILKRKKQ